jgi:hypothetical protein
MEERRTPDSYAEQTERQAEFEQLVREEDDWDEAVEDVATGEEPEADPESSPTFGP